VIAEAVSPVSAAAYSGLTDQPKTLTPWLFYDETGSRLFEQITALPEYYLTRTERSILQQHAEEILQRVGGQISVMELGAGTAAKTGILLQAASSQQASVLYQPIDVSPTALDEARENIEAHLPGVTVHPQIANYLTEPIRVERPSGVKILALYIGSSIGNFSPEESRGILRNLRAHLAPGDALLLGTDLAPSAHKSVARLLAAYDDQAGVTAAFNRNVLTRLNRELAADFDVGRFAHEARWNATESRIEMHLVSTEEHAVNIPSSAAGPALSVRFEIGESIHTENSYKFSEDAVADLLLDSGFAPTQSFLDPDQLFALTLATVMES
jgi:dimethylhistidine N-methyltransferase